MSVLPLFETERLILREVTEADAASYEKHFADYEVIGHLTPVVPWPYPKGGVLDYFRTLIFPVLGSTEWMWGLRLKKDPSTVIGAIHLIREGNPANRAFWLGRAYWGMGYMTEAVVPVLDYAFDALGFEKLILSNALGNQRSRRVKEKSGARLLRVEPAKFVNPAYTERELWELTRADWQAFSQSSALHRPA